MAKQTFTTGQVLTAAQMTSLQQTAMLGGAASAKTASYTLVAADAGTAISMSNASATTITVNTALFAAGDTVQITNLGAGLCTITAGTATVNTSASLALAQYESGTLNFTSTSAAIFIKGAGAAAAGGGLTLLSTTSLTGSSVTVSSISQSYKNLFIVVKNVYCSADNKFITVSLNGTANSHTYGYFGASGATLVQDSSRDEVSFLLVNGIGSTSTNSYLATATLSIINYTDTGTRTYTGNGLGILNAGTRQSAVVTGTYYAASAVSSIVFASNGTFSGGSVLIYGVN